MRRGYCLHPHLQKRLIDILRAVNKMDLETQREVLEYLDLMLSLNWGSGQLEARHVEVRILGEEAANQ